MADRLLESRVLKNSDIIPEADELAVDGGGSESLPLVEAVVCRHKNRENHES